MQTGLLHLHNLLRWVILITLLLSLVHAFQKNEKLGKSSLWLMIAAHTTLLIGLFQWFTGPFGLHAISESGFGAIMKDKASRYWAVEHAMGMIIAILLITIGRGKAKKLNYKAAGWLYLVTLLILLATIPWPFKELVGRPWFPGM